MNFLKRMIKPTMISIAIIVSILLIVWVVMDIKKKDLAIIFYYLLISIELLIILVFIFFLFVSEREVKIQYNNIINQNNNLIFEKVLSLSNSGIIYFNSRGNIIYVSNSLTPFGFSTLLGQNIKTIHNQFHDVNTDKQFVALYNDSYFEFNLLLKQRTIVIKDINDIRKITEKYKNDNLGFIMLGINFINTSYVKDQESETKVIVDTIFSTWIKKNNGYLFSEYRTDNLVIAVMSHKDLVIALTEIDKIQIQMKNKFESSNIKSLISIGVSYGLEKVDVLANAANEAIQLANSRGSDQIVINEIGVETRIIGGDTESHSSLSRLRIRSFTETILETFKHYDKFLLTGHVEADLDALGGMAGVAKFLSILNKPFSFLFDPGDRATKTIYHDFFPKEWRKNQIDLKDVKQLLHNKKNKIAVIIVDTSFSNQLSIVNHLENFDLKDLYIIDHHRMGVTTINHLNDNIYVDTGSSSTSEIMTEILQFTKMKINFNLELNVANILFAGIFLDTNQLTRHVGFKTFEVLSFLKKMGAEEEKIYDLFKPSLLEEQLFSQVVKNINYITPKVVISYLDDKTLITNVEISIMTEKLMAIQNIEAAFVVGRIEEHKVKVSARSTPNFNVQYILENIGGGGHFQSAAAVSTKLSVEEMKNDLIDILKSRDLNSKRVISFIDNANK